MNTTSSTSTAKAGARERIATRAAMGALDLVGFLVPLVGALGAAWFIDAQLSDGVTGFTRLAYTVLGAIAALGAIDNVTGGAIARPYRRLCGRVNGARTWSCDDCPATFTAAHWSLAEAVVIEELLADPAAHNCPAHQ